MLVTNGRSTVTRWMVLTTLALVVGACAPRAAGTRPDDMSLAQHRAAASQAARAAQEHRQRYDPKAEETRPRTEFPLADDVGVVWPDSVYNPTDEHLAMAKELQEEARQHRAAAEALARYEEGACRAFPQATRVKCPLLGRIAAIDEIDGGIRIKFTKGAPIKAMLAHMECHVAFARSMGHRGMPGCPLYLPQVQVRLSPDAAAVEIVSDQAATVNEIRRRTRGHLPYGK